MQTEGAAFTQCSENEKTSPVAATLWHNKAGSAHLTLHLTRGWTQRSKKRTCGTITSKMSSPTRRNDPPKGTCRAASKPS